MQYLKCRRRGSSVDRRVDYFAQPAAPASGIVFFSPTPIHPCDRSARDGRPIASLRLCKRHPCLFQRRLLYRQANVLAVDFSLSLSSLMYPTDCAHRSPVSSSHVCRSSLFSHLYGLKALVLYEYRFQIPEDGWQSNGDYAEFGIKGIMPNAKVLFHQNTRSYKRNSA